MAEGFCLSVIPKQNDPLAAYEQKGDRLFVIYKKENKSFSSPRLFLIA